MKRGRSLPSHPRLRCLAVQMDPVRAGTGGIFWECHILVTTHPGREETPMFSHHCAGKRLDGESLSGTGLGRELPAGKRGRGGTDLRANARGLSGEHKKKLNLEIFS